MPKKKTEKVDEVLSESEKEIAKEIEEGLLNEPEAEEEIEEKELEAEAEKESTTEEKELEERKKKLLKKAQKLKEKITSETKTEDLKEKIKIKKRTDMLVQLEDYVKSGIYIGTKVITPQMRQFVYRRRADGLAIFNTDLIDEKLKETIEFLSKFNPEDIVLVCKRQAGWKAAEKFAEVIGAKVFTKKYPAGILTNTKLPDFFENELTIVCDSWLDRNALRDTMRVHKQILMVCDTNNFPRGANQIIIGNNKNARSLGLMFYLLTRGYCKARGIEAEIPDMDWWTKETEIEPVKEEERARVTKGAEWGV